MIKKNGSVDYSMPYEFKGFAVQQAIPNGPFKEIDIRVLVQWEDIVRIEQFDSPYITSKDKCILYTRYHIGGSGVCINHNFDDLKDLWFAFKEQNKLGLYSHN